MQTSDITVEYVDLAYSAGFIDGEGCIIASNAGVTVKVSHTHLPSLEFLKGQFGGYINPRSGTNKAAWVWAVHGNDARDCLTRLRPLLKEKQPQADLALNILLLRPGRGIKPSYDVAAHRDKLRKELSDLKK